jgi:SAM-dependent methyltransferase
LTTEARANRWDELYAARTWDYLSTDPAELNRLQLASGWIDRFGARRVLDVGCGKGQLLGVLNPSSVSAYVGLEASSVALDQFSARSGIHCTVYVHDIQSESMPELGLFDCICFMDVLQYVNDPAELIQNFRPLLSDNGFMITCHYLRPERVLAGTSLWEVMTAEPDERIERGGVCGEVLDALTLVSMTKPRRWHMKAFRPNLA